MRTVSITTLGCKSNQYDSSAMEDALAAGGLRPVSFPGPADAYVINTCTVTARTDAQSRRLVRSARRLNPDALVIVTGCYAQVSPGEVLGIEGVDYILGNPEKASILDYIKKGRPPGGAEAAVGGHGASRAFARRARSSLGRARANLKIQEGCDRSCAYCIIPKARGPSRSLPLGEVRSEVEALIEAGYAEIVLTGIHLGGYGADLNPAHGLVSVLKLIEEKDYQCRFRLSSLDPDEATDELIDLLKGSRRICNHVHLALQSGDDAILKRMKRQYAAKAFAGRVERIVSEVKGVAVGADVIAGFPGEGEREFENTLSLLKDIPLAYLHVFPYSKRPGTAAADYPGHASPALARKRRDRLNELDSDMRAAFYRGFAGSTALVLAEYAVDKKTGLRKGRARNYIPVAFAADASAAGREVAVSLKGCGASGMTGEVIA